MGTEQITVRLPEELLAEVDGLVARGVYDSRAATISAPVFRPSPRPKGGARSIGPSPTDIAEAAFPPARPSTKPAVASLRGAILDEPW